MATGELTASYIDWEDACYMVGADPTAIDNIKDPIIQWVETLGIELELGRDISTAFQENTVSSSDPELHSIERDDQDTLIAKHFPIISVTRLRDNIQASNSNNILTLTEHTNFEIEKETGLIRLTGELQDSNLMKKIEFFTQGYNTVDLCYVWGFTSIPNDVKAFANLMAAALLRQYDKMVASGESAGLKRLQMGDYEEEVGDMYKNAQNEFMASVKLSSYRLKSKYGNYV